MHIVSLTSRFTMITDSLCLRAHPSLPPCHRSGSSSQSQHTKLAAPPEQRSVDNCCPFIVIYDLTGNGKASTGDGGAAVS